MTTPSTHRDEAPLSPVTFALVILLEAALIAALWWIGQVYA